MKVVDWPTSSKIYFAYNLAITILMSVFSDDQALMYSFSLNPASSRISFWSVIMYSFVASMETIGIGQPSVQRYCALNSEKKAKL